MRVRIPLWTPAPYPREVTPEQRYSALASILSDLDRCEHGRHQKDRCFGCPNGWSTGNLLLPRPGEVVGHDLGGRPYVVPTREQSFADPQAWRPQTSDSTSTVKDSDDRSDG